MPNTGAAGEMLGSRTALGSPFHLFALLFPKAASLLLMISCSLGSVGPLPLTFVNVTREHSDYALFQPLFPIMIILLRVNDRSCPPSLQRGHL